MQVPRYSGAGPDVKCAHNNNLTPTSNQALDARRGGEKLNNRKKTFTNKFYYNRIYYCTHMI